MLPVPPNITVQIFRGFDPGSPYPDPGRAPDVPNVRGFLNGALELGRFGYQTKYLYYTHTLWLPAGTDIRSAYDTQNDPSRNNPAADTVIIPDWPLPGQCTALNVVMVQRDRAQNFLRVYLDKIRTKIGKCNIGSPCGGCQGLTPHNWQLTVSGITSGLCNNGSQLNGAWTLAPDPITPCQWKTSQVITCASGLQGVAWLLTGPFPPAPQSAWNLYALGGGMASDQGGRSIPTYRCDPAQFQCNASNTFVLNPAGIATCGSGNNGSCCGNWPQSVTVSPA
jgi:hypothetical protein